MFYFNDTFKGLPLKKCYYSKLININQIINLINRVIDRILDFFSVYKINNMCFYRTTMRHKLINSKWKLTMITSSIFLTLNTVVFGGKRKL